MSSFQGNRGNRGGPRQPAPPPHFAQQGGRGNQPFAPTAPQYPHPPPQYPHSPPQYSHPLSPHLRQPHAPQVPVAQPAFTPQNFNPVPFPPGHQAPGVPGAGPIVSRYHGSRPEIKPTLPSHTTPDPTAESPAMAPNQPQPSSAPTSPATPAGHVEAEAEVGQGDAAPSKNRRARRKQAKRDEDWGNLPQDEYKAKQLDARLSQMTQEKNGIVRAMQAEQAVRREKEAELQRANEKSNALELHNVELEKQLRSAKEDLEWTQLANRDKANRLDDVGKFYEAGQERLQAELDATKENLERERASSKDKELRIATAESGRKTAVKSLEETEKKLQKATSDLKMQATNSTAARATLKTTEQDLKTANSEKIKLTKEVEKLQKQLEVAGKTYQLPDGTIKETKKHIEDLEGARRHFEETAQGLQADVEAIKSASKEKESGLEKEIQRLSQENKKLELAKKPAERLSLSRVISQETLPSAPLDAAEEVTSVPVISQGVQTDDAIEQPMISQGVQTDIAVEQPMISQGMQTDTAVEQSMISSGIRTDIAVEQPMISSGVQTDMANEETEHTIETSHWPSWLGHTSSRRILTVGGILLLFLILVACGWGVWQVNSAMHERQLWMSANTKAYRLGEQDLQSQAVAIMRQATDMDQVGWLSPESVKKMDADYAAKGMRGTW
ncbi:hypothetical protein ACLMJK_003054 [Lecanora helva]